jgi:hypothetical protein
MSKRASYSDYQAIIKGNRRSEFKLSPNYFTLKVASPIALKRLGTGVKSLHRRDNELGHYVAEIGLVACYT